MDLEGPVQVRYPNFECNKGCKFHRQELSSPQTPWVFSPPESFLHLTLQSQLWHRGGRSCLALGLFLFLWEKCCHSCETILIQILRYSSIANSIFPIKSVGRSVGRVLILQGLQACYQCTKLKGKSTKFQNDFTSLRYGGRTTWWSLGEWKIAIKNKQGRHGRGYASIYKATETGESGENT